MFESTDVLRLRFSEVSICLGVLIQFGTGFILSADEGGDFFEKRIRPVLIEHCYECHSAKAKKLRGNLYLDSAEGWKKGGDSGPVIEPGHPADSLLMRAVDYGDEELEMPPKQKLSTPVIEDFGKWIAMGAPTSDYMQVPNRSPLAISEIDLEQGRRFWSLQPLRATTLVRPSMGTWVTYGLGIENKNLPGFVSICPSALIGGARNYSSAFIPSIFSGTALGKAERPASEAKFRNLGSDCESSRERFRFLQELNQTQSAVAAEPGPLDSVINSFEAAFGMQQHAPEISDLSRESRGTMERCGIGVKATDDFWRQCILARRLSEAGVRFVQVNFTDNTTTPKWDQHCDLERDHRDDARVPDRSIAALLVDLKQRGLLEERLVMWGGEFGRPPYSGNGNGRDHNPHCATVWLAGGGVRAGYSHGVTDELGFRSAENKVHVHDLHATILHLIGLDHEKLTYRYSGRDFRLTDVFGNVIREVIS